MNIKITDYIPGAIGKITQIHGIYYSKHWGFTINFESEVAKELSDFLLNFNIEKDLFKLAVVDDSIKGSIAICSNDKSPDAARLRWFILSENCHGQGIGKILMNEAIDFCKKKGFKTVILWTFAGLDSARHLYEEFGFKLIEEYEDSEWGNSIVHQKFVLGL